MYLGPLCGRCGGEWGKCNCPGGGWAKGLAWRFWGALLGVLVAGMVVTGAIIKVLDMLGLWWDPPSWL